MTLSEACNVLHVDEGNNDELISALVAALPSYIETNYRLKRRLPSSRAARKDRRGLTTYSMVL